LRYDIDQRRDGIGIGFDIQSCKADYAGNEKQRQHDDNKNSMPQGKIDDGAHR
jgi:hypothetical protein